MSGISRIQKLPDCIEDYEERKNWTAENDVRGVEVWHYGGTHGAVGIRTGVSGLVGFRLGSPPYRSSLPPRRGGTKDGKCVLPKKIINTCSR